jgi:hypothetical protein
LGGGGCRVRLARNEQKILQRDVLFKPCPLVLARGLLAETHCHFVERRHLKVSDNRPPPKKLKAQSCRDLGLWQDCHEVSEESSKIVPLGAPVQRAANG